MTTRTLDLEVLRRGRPEDMFTADGDPDGAEFGTWLRDQLRAWLAGRKWGQSLWGQFEIVAREAGRMKPLAKARAA